MVTIFPNNRRALLAFLHDVVMAALSIVASLYLRLGDDILDYEPRLTVIYVVGFTADCRGRVSADRALSRHLALRLAARSLQHRPRGDPDRAGLPAGDVRAHPARDAAAIDAADRLVRADRAAGRAAARLSAVQGSRSRPHPRTRQAPERAGAADQRQGRRRHLHPRDACATRVRSIGSSACSPTRRRASAGEIYGCRSSARSMRSKPWSRGSIGAASARKS